MTKGVALTPVAFGLTAFLLLLVAVVGKKQEACSRTCVALTCDGYGIRYGKYCGLGYTGCPGEEPCDELDYCCMKHDECVDAKGLTFINCHKKLQHCVNDLSRSIKKSNDKKHGFSKKCPYSTVIPTVYKGMEHGIFFSKIGNFIQPGDQAPSGAEAKNGLQTNQGSNVLSPSPSASLSSSPS